MTRTRVVVRKDLNSFDRERFNVYFENQYDRPARSYRGVSRASVERIQRMRWEFEDAGYAVDIWA